MLVQKRGEQMQQQIQPKISTIFKEKVVDIPQAFGSFIDGDGEKYCAIFALLKYLGFNISRIATVGNEIQNDKNNINIELIPSDILEMVENLGSYTDTRKPPAKCFCSKPDYYSYSLISLLIHLNDCHKMTFVEIGKWFESKGM
jgi:hypothetical protein